MRYLLSAVLFAIVGLLASARNVTIVPVADSCLLQIERTQGGAWLYSCVGTCDNNQVCRSKSATIGAFTTTWCECQDTDGSNPNHPYQDCWAQFAVGGGAAPVLTCTSGTCETTPAGLPTGKKCYEKTLPAPGDTITGGCECKI